MRYFWLALLGLSCEGDKDEPIPLPDGDADADSDADTDADTDIDACADAEISGDLPLTVTGSTLGAGDELQPSCVLAGDEDYAYAFTAPHAGRFQIDTWGSLYDTVLSVLDGCGGLEIACSDDTLGQTPSSVILDLIDGESIIIVIDGYDVAGDFTLNLSELPSIESACADGLDEDFDGAADCIDPDCAAAPGCQPACPDLAFGALPAELSIATTGAPDESTGSCDPYAGYFGPAPDVSISLVASSDGRYLLRAEGGSYAPSLSLLSGCGGAEIACGFGPLAVDLGEGEQVLLVVDGLAGESWEGSVFAEEIPSGEAACADGLDEDFDGAADCLDADCASAPGCQPVCPDLTLDGLLSPVDGSTVGAPDEVTASCLPPDLPDQTFSFAAPADGAYGFVATGESAESVALVLLDSCGGAELDCELPGHLVRADLLLGETVIVAAERQSPGALSLVAFEIVGSELSLCEDGLDNDADGSRDCLDADCVLDPACVEICGNGLDDDLDLSVDCLDADCAPDPGCLPSCPEATLGARSPVVYEGDTLGSPNGWEPSCVLFEGASDAALRFVAPEDADYTFSTAGTPFDTAVYLLEGDCAGDEIACNDDAAGLQSEVTAPLLEGQAVIVVVDGYEPLAAGPFTLTVSW